MTKVVELPRFLTRIPVYDDLAIDQNFNGPDVAGEISGVAERLRKFRRG